MDQMNVDQNQFMKQVRERAQVLSRNARQNPDEVVEKVSQYNEEDKEMKDFLNIIRSTEKEEKMESDEFDLDFASQLASSSQLDFSKERFKAGLAQRRVQKRRRPQSWAWAATTDNEAVKIKETQGSMDVSLNISIKTDEDSHPVEVPNKTTRPMNRFSSPLFSNKLMSDLGNVLSKKKSPLGKPSPPIKAGKNVHESTEGTASQLLKSKSPVSSPRPVSPMTPPSESPQHSARIHQSASPNLVLVTEKDVFGLQQSPILQRRLQESDLRQITSEPGYLKPNEDFGEIDKKIGFKDSVNDEDASNAANVSCSDILKPQKKPPPPKPKTKLKSGQSSAMLVKNTAEQSKPDVAKEEEKRVLRTKPRWLDELQKKKVKCNGDAAKQDTGPSMTAYCDQMSSDSDVTSLSSDTPVNKDESSKREKPLTKIESPTDALPAWMKLEFSKMKKGSDKTEAEDSSLLGDRGQEGHIDYLLTKPKAIEPSKPSWLDQLNKRRKKQVSDSDGHDGKLKESDARLTVSEHFDYRSHEELKQKDQENVVDEDETDGVMESVSDIKKRLNKKNISNENQHILKKTTPFKNPDDDLKMGERCNATGYKEGTPVLRKVVPSDTSEKNKEFLGKSKENVNHFDGRAIENKSKNFALDGYDMIGKAGSNTNAKVENICNDAKNNNTPESAPFNYDVVKGMNDSVDGDRDESTLNKCSSESENELLVKTPAYREEQHEHSHLENRLCENSGSADIQQETIKISEDIDKSALSLELNKKDTTPVPHEDMKDRNVASGDYRGNRYLSSGSSGRDAAKGKDAIEKDILKDNSKIQLGKSEEVKVDPILGMGYRGEDEGKVGKICPSVTTKDGRGDFAEKDVKLSPDKKIVENLQAMDQIKNLASTSSFDSSISRTHPEQHSGGERRKYDENGEERNMFTKPLRRKLVHINSFEQGISKPTYTDGQKNTVNEKSEDRGLIVKQQPASDVKKALDIENKVENKSKGGGDKNSDTIDADGEIGTTSGDRSLSFKAEVDKNYDKDTSISDTKQEIASTQGGSSSQDTKRNASLFKTEAFQGDSMVLGDGTDSEKDNHKKAIFELKKKNNAVQKDGDPINRREKAITASSGVDKDLPANEQKSSDVHRDATGVVKNSLLLDKEQEPTASIKRPPPLKPKPKPKPKQRPPLRNALEIKNSPQQEESNKATFTRSDSHESKIQPNKVQVTQIENLKNIEKGKSGQELRSEKEQSNEKINEKYTKAAEKVKVEMRRKDENGRKQTRPVSMFENISSVDNSLPIREKKFSGISSGSKFAMELERKQKSCWFRGAMDTNDIKSIDDYDGNDDIPAWKRQLLARLKSNEGPTAKNSERGHVADDQKKEEGSNFRSRTVTSPDGLSIFKKIAARKSAVIEEATSESNVSLNEENEREVPAFLLEFASKKQLKAQRESGLPKMQEEKQDDHQVLEK